jgi:hypothetical protein
MAIPIHEYFQLSDHLTLLHMYAMLVDARKERSLDILQLRSNNLVFSSHSDSNMFKLGFGDFLSILFDIWLCVDFGMDCSIKDIEARRRSKSSRIYFVFLILCFSCMELYCVVCTTT